MDNPTAFKLLEELRQQCRFAQYAFQHLRTSLNAIEAEPVFFYAHAFLAHAVNVSRLLWPERAESKGRGDFLRSELKIAEDSALRLRDYRAQAGRFDERLEDWLHSLENRDYSDMNIMPQGAITGFKPEAFQRNLDPDVLQLYFRSERCDLRPVAEELRKLEATTQNWLRTHKPW